jgi:hypothetical protein
MKFLLCVFLSSCAIQAMDPEANSSEETNCSEQAEFDLSFEPNFDEWQQRIQGSAQSDDEEDAEPIVKKVSRKRITRTRPVQQNFDRDTLIEIAFQNLYRLGGIAQPATPAVAQSFFKPHYANGIYQITCPVCFYKIASKEIGKAQKDSMRQQVRRHLQKSDRHLFDGVRKYSAESLERLVIPLYQTMIAGRKFKDVCMQKLDVIEELPAENPYTLKKFKSDNEG